MATRNILRFATAGSVDDGKSSLIGRLLYDAKAILEDQLLSIERASVQRGSVELELALLTDGLRAEREQNITIDVAYRYFATAKRKFIIADTPGHIQYTRNMVTGASTADLSVILIDARKGVLSQSKRHAAISALLGIRHVVVAINKMDLVDFQEARYCDIVREFGSFTRKLGTDNVTFIPISALLGDNVVERSTNMSWYDGPPLLQFLEEVDVAALTTDRLRLPIQAVIRPNQEYRGFAGRLESGTLRLGDTVEVASSRLRAQVQSIRVSGAVSSRAEAGQAVAISLDREIDVSRGDMFYTPCDPPLRGDRLDALVCWMHEQPLEVGRRYLMFQGPRKVSAVVEQVVHRIDVDTLDPVAATRLELNDLGRIVLRVANPLTFDRYSENPGTGSFVLIDPGTHATVAGGMLQGLSDAADGESEAPIVGRAIWLEGFDAEAEEIAAALRRIGEHVVLLTPSDGLTASDAAGWISRLTGQGINVVVSGFAAPDDAAIRMARPEIAHPADAVEAILPHLPHRHPASPPVTGNL